MTTIEKYSYEIDESNAVKIWDLENPNENNAPFCFQPDNPDGTPWENKNAAKVWAENTIDKLLNPDPIENIELTENVE
jgi:hypothetical protein